MTNDERQMTNDEGRMTNDEGRMTTIVFLVKGLFKIFQICFQM
nr:MAG TPA: hypothetical protein [Caudoviricetes sp.]